MSLATISKAVIDAIRLLQRVAKWLSHTSAFGDRASMYGDRGPYAVINFKLVVTTCTA
jgi:hypothetical protein